MMRESYANRQQNPPVLENMEIVVALVLMAVCWFSWYVARERYHLTDRQIAEMASYLIIRRLGRRRLHHFACHRALQEGEGWPHPPMVCRPQTGRASFVRSLETRRGRSRLRHPWQTLALAGPRARHARNRAGHDRHRQDNVVAKYHFAGSRAGCRSSGSAASTTDGDLRWQRGPRVFL